MLEGKPRESLVLYDTAFEIAAGVDPSDPFKKTYGCKLRLVLKSDTIILDLDFERIFNYYL